MVPSMRSAAETTTQAQLHKAAGPDGVTNDLFKAAPEAMLRHTHPFQVKVALRSFRPPSPDEVRNRFRCLRSFNGVEEFLWVFCLLTYSKIHLGWVCGPCAQLSLLLLNFNE